MFVRNRSLDYQDVVFYLALSRITKWPHEVIAIGQREERIVQVDFGNPGQGVKNKVFNTGLGSCSHGNRIAIATQAGGNPQDFDLRDR